MKKLKIALQMDDIATLKFESDSSILLGMEAQKRGYDLYYYQPKQLFMLNNEVIADMYPLSLSNEKDSFYKLGELFRTNLSSIDVVLIRQNPPCDMDYITNCLMLEKLPATTLIVNNPKAIRDLPEKLFICGFPSLTPPTLVTKNIDVAREFRNQHLNIVVKPIYSYSGNDVFVVKEGDENFDVIIASLIKTYNQPLIFQKFIPEVKNGEKRIFLIDGKAVAAILKIPAKDQIRANLVAGSRVYSYKLSNQDLLICDQLGAELKKRGVIFAGIDMIGGYITEINITSPTLIGYANKLDNISIESMIWDKIEEKIL